MYGQKRRGFTLIEMLVVIAIIGILAGLAVFAFPSFTSKKRAGTGGSQLQGWLFLAKQRALRDGAPRGLRLFFDASNKVTQCQYTEQPDDFNGGNLTAQNTAVQLSGIDVRQGGGTDKTFWSVQPGDFLEIQGVGLPHRIVDVNVGGSGTILTLESPVPYTITAPGTPSYRIIRSPRVVGDEPLDLPEDVVVDLQTNTTYGNPLPGGFPGANGLDILFSPSGKVITPGVTTDYIALWVRDTTYADVFEGNPAIIAVHVRSGLVAGTRPASPADPYQYVRTGVTPND